MPGGEKGEVTMEGAPCSDECKMPPKRMSDGKTLFSPALARKTHLELPGVMRSPKPPGGAQITKIKNRETKCTRPQIARREKRRDSRTKLSTY